jgi:hypothetical protein
MKVLRIFKKPVFLITLVVLAAILSVSMIAVGAENAEFGGSVSKYQVGMQGSVMFKLTLDNPGAGMEDTDSYEVTVGERKRDTYPVSQVKADGYIVVRLKPTEMSKDVTVTAVKGDKNREIWTGSVKGYAETILASETYASSHNVMRAMLNWGAKTETKFATSDTTADGIFARNSDPMNAVTDNTIKAPAHGDSEFNGSLVPEGSTTEIILGEGNVTLRFKIKATEDLGTTLTATVSRDGWTESKTTTATYDSTENCYIVNIDSISTLLFDKVYTVSISNGTDSVTAYASVLENLDKIIEGKGSDTSEGVKNVAKTLYQFYLLSADKIDSGCKHGVGSYWLSSSEAGKDCYMCAACFKQVGQPVAENIELYLSPEALAAKGIGNSNNNNINYFSSECVDNDGEFPYFRIKRTATSGYYDFNIIPSCDTVKGQYLIIKYRSENSVTNLNAGTSITTYANTSAYTGGNLYAKSRNFHVKDTEEGAGQWHVMVGDLSKNTTSFIKGEDGYYASSIILRLLGRDWSGGTITGAAVDDYFDIAYIALVDDLTDVKDVVSESTYDFTWAQLTNYVHVHNTADNACTVAGYTTTDTTHTPNACSTCGKAAGKAAEHTYGNVGGVRKCTFCGNVNAEFFLSAEDFNSKLANANKTDFTQEYVADQGEFPYFHVERTAVTTGNRYEFNIVNLFPNGTAVKGKYLIIKYRSVNSTTSDQTNAMTIFGDTAGDSGTYSKKMNYKVIDSGENAGNWYVMVCDLSKINEKFATENAKNLYIRLFGKDWSGSGMTNAAVGDYFDIAYMAIVDEEADIKNIVTDKTYDYTASSTTSVTKNTETNQAVN